MKNLRRTFTVLFAAAFSMQVLAQREDKLINQDWSFRFSHQVNASAARRVDLPHTWNAQDALGGKHDYKRGIGNSPHNHTLSLTVTTDNCLLL